MKYKVIRKTQWWVHLKSEDGKRQERIEGNFDQLKVGDVVTLEEVMAQQ